MTNSNISNKIQLEIIQQHLETVSGNALLISNDLDLINLISSDNLQVLSNPDKIISDHIDNLLLTNSLEENISKENKKFDTIIIHDLFEQIKNPKSFLQHLDSVLTDNGTIICSISNFSHINKIFNLIIGNIENTFFNTSRFYDLNSFLLFLNQSNMHTTKLTRVKQEFSSESMKLDDTLIPSQLIEMYKKIPDHDVTQYVFMIGKGKSVSSETLDFSTQFPKNYLLPKLQEFFEKYNEFKLALTEKDKVIEGLENSIEDITGYSGNALAKKDKVIEGYEESIKDIKNNAVPALDKKDKVIEGLENSIEEQKNYVGVALDKKDKVIEGLENSLEEQKNYTESALQVQKEYTESALAKKDKVIEGLENSLEEQKNYIENIEEHVRQLESKMGKLKFWKK
jgi:uncharacterized coiled-coil protein SlyX